MIIHAVIIDTNSQSGFARLTNSQLLSYLSAALETSHSKWLYGLCTAGSLMHAIEIICSYFGSFEHQLASQLYLSCKRTYTKWYGKTIVCYRYTLAIGQVLGQVQGTQIKQTEASYTVIYIRMSVFSVTLRCYRTLNRTFLCIRCCSSPRRSIICNTVCTACSGNFCPMNIIITTVATLPYIMHFTCLTKS